MVTKHIQMCSISLLVSHVWAIFTVRLYTHQSACMKKTDTSKSWWECRPMGALLYHWSDYKLVLHLGKQFGIIYWSEGICTLGPCNSNPRYIANRNACKYILRHIYNNVVVAICKIAPYWKQVIFVYQKQNG